MRPVAPRVVDQVASLRGRAASFGQSSSGLVPLETFSVVLPCAYEGNYAVKTVEALWENTQHHRLLEILVVDDGSQPPLRTQFPAELLAGTPGRAPVRIIRHERTLGLIAAKKTGGDAARGDVIVFFDCHISPRRGWEEAFIKQMKRAGDHRTVVVPTITSLDPDTWKEIDNGAQGKVCYVLWNADFTWLTNPGRDVPLMSGGLLALSRRWWEETGGYDNRMVAWGGENIDQSIRVWLCGGRIEVADGAYVAHMWRDPKNPKTQLRYPIPTKDVMRNKARAVQAWFGAFSEKVMTFPEYEQFTKQHESWGDMSDFDALKSKLQCRPFTSYLSRFSYVYFDSGLIPSEVFQIREASSNRCLQRDPRDTQPHGVILAPCSGGEGGGSASELQLWHAGNRDHKKPGKACCSGLMNWNFLQCLDAQAVGGRIKTFECEISGTAANQFFSVPSDGQLFWRPASSGQSGEGCVAPAEPRLADARYVSPVQCQSRVEATSGATFSPPGDFRIRGPPMAQAPEGTCATAAASETADSLTGFSLAFMPCRKDEPNQVFHAKPMMHGFQIVVGSTKSCLDAASGTQLLVYPCYEASAGNANQVWQLRSGRLQWERLGGSPSEGFCIDQKPIEKAEEQHRPGDFTLQICAPKAGQVLRREDVRGDGTFLLRDRDAGTCLAASSDGVIGLGACDSHQRWRELVDREQVQHVKTGLCIDGGDDKRPVLYACHQPRAMQKQRFEIVDTPGWVRMKPMWGDNGRRRWFEKCLDWKLVKPTDLSLKDCAAARHLGLHWERWNAFVPLERKLWEQAEKPTGPVLGGDAEPP